MNKESTITKSNLLVLQLLEFIDKGHVVDIGEMTTQVAILRLDNYLMKTCNVRLTVGDTEYFDLVSRNLTNFWNVKDNDDFRIENNGLIFLVISLLELSRSGYREDL